MFNKEAKRTSRISTAEDMTPEQRYTISKITDIVTGKRVKLLRIGSTGRSEPRNIREQVAMHSAMSKPENGIPTSVPLSDKRWRREEGWVKMAQNVNGVEIHYNMNKNTKQYDDFKFIDTKKTKD
jgi:hypothetical protein